MAGEGRTPSTRNARTSGQAVSGTGQRSTTAPGGVAKIGRSNDSPSKASGPQPAFSNTRRGEASGIDMQPPSVEHSARMVRDSGPKTERERTFARINAEIRSKLDGTGDRNLYPTQYERQKADYARDDKYSGSKPGYRPKQNQ